MAQHSALASAPDKSALQQTRSAWSFHGKDSSTLSQAPKLDRETSVPLSWWKRQSPRPQETEGEEMTYS